MSSRAVVQPRLTEGYGAMDLKVTDYSEHTCKQEGVEAGCVHESEGVKVTVVVFNNSDLTNPI